MFDQVAEPRRAPDKAATDLALHVDPGKVQQLWDLISANHGNVLDTLSIQERELLGTVAPHLPALKPLIMRTFVADLQRALKRRRHSFQPRTEDTLTIRGRVDVRSLADREARGTLPVTCHFDDLSHDSPAWQILRTTNRLIVGDAEARKEDADLAAQLDNRLSDVSVLPASHAVRALITVRGSQEGRSLRRLLQLSRCLLTLRYPVGALADESTDFAMEIKIATSGLWETLLANALNSYTDYRAHTQGSGIALRLFDQGKRKRPDIVLTSPDPQTVRPAQTTPLGVDDVNFVIDAKYKILAPPESSKKSSVPRMSWLSMPDQYQCFAYATLLNAPALFITVGTEDRCTAWTSPVPGQSATGHPVGIASVRFPAPGETSLSADAMRNVVNWLQEFPPATPERE